MKMISHICGRVIWRVCASLATICLYGGGGSFIEQGLTHYEIGIVNPSAPGGIALASASGTG